MRSHPSPARTSPRSRVRHGSRLYGYLRQAGGALDPAAQACDGPRAWKVTELSRPIQELATEYAWGAIWTRKGLELRDRSLINLAMLTVLNRSHELAVHVRGAVINGVTRSEFQEVLMQAAVYAGMPAALEAFRIAEATLTDLEAEGVEVP